MLKPMLSCFYRGRTERYSWLCITQEFLTETWAVDPIKKRSVWDGCTYLKINRIILFNYCLYIQLVIGIIMIYLRYRAFRKPYGVEGQYEYTMAFWHVFAARLAFVVVFEVIL
jgi:hypothetical protein